MVDLPSGLELLELGHSLLLDDLLPMLPPERQRELRLVATAIAITRREAMAGDGPLLETTKALRQLYKTAEGEKDTDRTAGVSPACRPIGSRLGAGGPSGIPHLTPTLSAP